MLVESQSGPVGMENVRVENVERIAKERVDVPGNDVNVSEGIANVRDGVFRIPPLWIEADRGQRRVERERG